MEQKSCSIVVGIVLILAVIIVIFSNCFNRVTTGNLKVTSNPSEVNVILGEKTYVTPFSIDNIKPGEYTLHAYKSGYKVKDIPIKIESRKSTDIQIDLEVDPVDKEIIEGAPN